jgi:hypothetical protein
MINNYYESYVRFLFFVLFWQKKDILYLEDFGDPYFGPGTGPRTGLRTGPRLTQMNIWTMGDNIYFPFLYKNSSRYIFVSLSERRLEEITSYIAEKAKLYFEHGISLIILHLIKSHQH